MALTKAEMAERLFDDLGLNKREAKEMVEGFYEEIRNSLASNQQVKLSGFGNFDLRDKKQRPGRNPKTGEDTTLLLMPAWQPSENAGVKIVTVSPENTKFNSESSPL